MTLKEAVAGHNKFLWADKIGIAMDLYMSNGEEQQDPELFAEMLYRLPDEHKQQLAERLLGSIASRAIRGVPTRDGFPYG